MNYCRDQFVPKKLYKRVGYKLLLCFFLSCIGSYFFYFHFSQQFANREKQLRKELVQTIQLDQKYCAREKTIPITDDIFETIQLWEKQLKMEAAKFPFTQKKPKIYPFFHWIYNNPLLKEKDFQIENFQAKLVSYPSIENPTNPYQMKVQIQFSLTEPIPNFQKTIEKSGFFDQTQEILWKTEKQKIQLIAYLNNQ